MKRVSTMNLVPGMVTAEDVYTYNNQLILPKGLVLSDKTITRLEFYSILNVRVEDALASDTEEQPTIEKVATYSEKVRSSEQFIEFKQNFEEELVKFQGFLSSVADGEAKIEPEELMSFVDDLLDSGSGYINVFDMLHNMRSYDDVTYVHSLNVALICNVFARWLKMSDEEIKLATLCGLLHDIGKVNCPDEIIKKDSKLSNDEYARVKRHTMEGYNILRNYPISESIMNSALMHHERCDGSGYPFGLRNAKIDSFAKMVAIADVYDAMTSARVYRGPCCPFTVIELFESEGLQKYDTRFIMTFLENVVNTYMLQTVRLSDGREGEVVFINRSRLSRPTIKIGSEFVDLTNEPDITIEAII